jgi:IS5 family transposase
MKAFFKKTGNIGFFDAEFAMDKLNSKRNILDRISGVVDFELFRPILEEAVLNRDKKSKAGAKSYDPVMIFKILILQRIYNISDEDTEYQIIDRLSFKKFLGLASGDKVPDQNTIWAFREKLVVKDTVSDLFNEFFSVIEEQGMIINEGKMIDATFVETPRQRNTREENDKIKSGEGEGLWSDQPNKKRHKDIDARWTKKNTDTFYGYKNHVKVDTKSKFIVNYVVTDASVHDSQVLEDLLEESDRGQHLHADSAYSGEDMEQIIAKYDMINKVHEKGSRNHPLDAEQKENNRTKSTIRVRVEHVFGFMEQSMKGIFVRSIGLDRSFTASGLYNLGYNICRYEQVMRLNLLPVKR